MYRIEYDIETGLVHNLAIVEDENYPETLVDGVAYYEGDIPEDVEGYEKVLYYKLVNTQKNPEGISTFAVWEGNLYAEYKPIEGWIELADAKDVADLFIQSQKPKGLKFKTGDNSVFAKTMKDLVLGTDDFTVCVVARTEGCGESPYPLLGFTKQDFSANSLKIVKGGGTGINGIYDVRFEGARSNVVNVLKTDNTTNLHHIVITRSGTLVTVTINGRLVKSVTQDRVLDFSNFIYDIANTSYFWGGSVFNYAMTQAESNKLLWNGGRYDEINLNSRLKSELINTARTAPSTWALTSGCSYNQATDELRIVSSEGEGQDVSKIFNNSKIRQDQYYLLEFEYKGTGFCTISLAETLEPVVSGSRNFGNSLEYTKYRCLLKQREGAGIDSFVFKRIVKCDIYIKNFKLSVAKCLLEYRPENIRSDRYLNSGIAGSDYDLVYSQTPPEIIYDKPYQDVVMLDENKAPDWHPIAMGQEVETPTNIFKAKLPDLGKEWQVSDWKQINN